MKIKIYNENGEVNVVKEINGKEYSMFKGLCNGEMAEINIESSVSVNASKILRVKEN